MQIMPRPSITSAPGAAISAPTATMAPSRTCTSPLASSPIAGSIDSTLAPRTTSSPRAGSGAGARPADRLCPVVAFCAAASPGSSPAAPSEVAAANTVRRSISSPGIATLPM
jgi:hypothetical protein